MAEPVLYSDENNDVCYEFTKTTFRKTSRLPLHQTRYDGSRIIWARSWNHERILNEVRALQIVASKTTIPVPKLLDYGVHADGRQYLVTELVQGVLLDRLAFEGCSEPQDHEYTDGTQCKLCLETAQFNAVCFIQDTVLPQLSQLKSTHRGIDGFVMPPSWLLPDVRAPWGNKKAFRTMPLPQAHYVFQHGDIASHNIIMDPKTLQVKSLIDWEYAGFFPPGMERWPGSFDKTQYYARARGLASPIAMFLAAEFLECCDNWPDKAQLQTLIKAGKIPDPEELRLESETEPCIFYRT